MRNTRGRVELSGEVVGVAGSKAQLRGGECGLEVGIRSSGTNRLNLPGTGQSPTMRAGAGLGCLAPVSTRLSGQAPYRLSLGVAGGQLQWVLTSPLSGLGIDLPAPLKKPANAAAGYPPLRVELTGLGGPAGAERERLDLQWGRLVQARFLRQASNGTWLAAAVGVGAAEPPPLPRVGRDLRPRAAELLRVMLVRAAGFGMPGLIAAPIGDAYLKDEWRSRARV